MLDLVPQNNFNVRGDTIEHTHHDINDTSLFETYAKFSRKPTLCEVDGLISELPNYKTIYNTATNSVVDMRPVPDSYKLVPHEKMLASHAEQFARQFPEYLNGLTVVDKLFESGKKAQRSVYFNDLTVDVGQGDKVKPRIDIYNSIDMSWAFQVFSGAYRQLCRNTLVFGGEKAFHQRRKHTRNLEPDAITHKANVSLDAFVHQRDWLKGLRDKHVSVWDFSKFLQYTLCNTADEKHPNRVNDALHTYLMKIWEDQEKDLGLTGWNAYNVLTHWSTHTLDSPRARKSHRVHDVQRQRADMVRDLLGSEEWSQLVTA